MNESSPDATVQRMVRTLRPEWTVREILPADFATDAVFYLIVETGEGPRECVLKACTAVPRPDFRPEPYILTLLNRRTSVPTPQVIGTVDDHGDLPAPFYLMEKCEGVVAENASLTSESLERVARAAGRYAGEYHGLGTFERFGRLRLDTDLHQSGACLTVDGRTLAVADEGATSWRCWIEDGYEDWIDDLDDRFVDRRLELEAFIESRLETIDGSFDAVLGHIDYKPWNILVDPDDGETTAVLDWGHATAMAPYYDLLLTEEHLSRWAPLESPRRRRVRTAIEAGYAETNELDRDPDFEVRRELYLAVSRLQPLVWFSEWMADDSQSVREGAADKHSQFVSDLLQ